MLYGRILGDVTVPLDCPLGRRPRGDPGLVAGLRQRRLQPRHLHRLQQGLQPGVQEDFRLGDEGEAKRRQEVAIGQREWNRTTVKCPDFFYFT